MFVCTCYGPICSCTSCSCSGKCFHSRCTRLSNEIDVIFERDGLNTSESGEGEVGGEMKMGKYCKAEKIWTHLFDSSHPQEQSIFKKAFAAWLQRAFCDNGSRCSMETLGNVRHKSSLKNLAYTASSLFGVSQMRIVRRVENNELEPSDLCGNH